MNHAPLAVDLAVDGGYSQPNCRLLTAFQGPADPLKQPTRRIPFGARDQQLNNGPALWTHTRTNCRLSQASRVKLQAMLVAWPDRRCDSSDAAGAFGGANTCPSLRTRAGWRCPGEYWAIGLPQTGRPSRADWLRAISGIGRHAAREIPAIDHPGGLRLVCSGSMVT